MEQKHIVIVNDGTFKEERPDHYNIFIRTIARCIEGEQRSSFSIASQQVVESIAEASDLVKEGKADLVFFVSVDESVCKAASELRTKYPYVGVVIFAGKKPDGLPYIVPKTAMSPELVKELILR